MRTVHLQTTLPTSADRVWRAMQSPVTFLYVCKGLFGVPALAGRSEQFRVGDRGTAWLFAFHFIPAYRHSIEVVDVDDADHTVRTHEHGGVLRAWNHTLRVESVGPDVCRYSDTVDIDAGPLTAGVAALAVGIYRYRQRRWHKLVRLQLAPQGPAFSR
ncbi:hypothetical protein PT015_15620 [Candidatus Mycobacterium wuenschmannii]|uniref:Ligand-binding SRPBCC domain-containing protein n=1 Tax=Candidatus Mycobacterium wuenschmannii TaxID=3027808 RepID=A0ABY8VVY6_9MYCO|nr:hypothetical protein [Candidatus Mycobacterium wuenschmannii]WIM86332.1 hypothetical protein PT015_15620 [Candidatus Mycobacterium wuenschmannii]